MGSKICKWEIFPSGYPSDFDLVTASLDLEALESLTDHPAIKSVSPQRSITRTLLEVPEHKANNDGKFMLGDKKKIEEHGLIL